jgi:hypothetical protein
MEKPTSASFSAYDVGSGIRLEELQALGWVQGLTTLLGFAVLPSPLPF